MQRLKACAFWASSPANQMIRVVTGSRPGAFGRRISPVHRRLWKTAPTGALLPIFFATMREPRGVVIMPRKSPTPYLHVDTGQIATLPHSPEASASDRGY